LFVGAALQSFRTLKASRKDPFQPFRLVFHVGMNAKAIRSPPLRMAVCRKFSLLN